MALAALSRGDLGSHTLQRAQREPIPPPPFFCTPLRAASTLSVGHPLPAAPPAPPAGQAGQVHLAQGRDVNSEYARRPASRCAAPLVQQECLQTTGQSGFHPPSTKPPGRRARAALAHTGRAGPGPLAAEPGRRRQGCGRGSHTRTLQFLAALGSPVSGRYSGFICLQADYVSSSLPSLPLDPPPGPFPAPSGSEFACVTMVRSRDWLESVVTLQLRTSFPRRYKKCRTEPASLRPPELEMQLLGASEAA